MRIALLIWCSLALAACEHRSSTLAVGAPEAAARDSGAGRVLAPTPERAKAPGPPSPAPAAMPAPEALTDSAITERIRNAILADPGMAGADVSINIDRGVVVLAGTVKSHEQTGIASGHAQSQDGVVRVDNHLRPTLS